jgi:hypothetical protein
MDTRIAGPLAGLLLRGANAFGATGLVAAALYGLGRIARGSARIGSVAI